MIEFLVGVIITGLKQHLLGRLGEQILIVHLDAISQVFSIDLFGSHIGINNCLFLQLIGLLESYFRLQITISMLSTDALSLGKEAWGIGSGLMLKEGVWVSWFSAESRSRYKLGIDVRLEGLVRLSDAVTERL